MNATASPASLTVRPARAADIAGLHTLIRHYSDQGILLPRTKQNLREMIQDFRVISSHKQIVACATLHFYTPVIAELRSLAVAPSERGLGLGRLIVEALLDEARARDLEMVFAFTYAVDFFAKLGFFPIDRALVPWKAWNDCSICPKRECCDEIAVACRLKPPLFPIFSRHTAL